MLTASSAIFTKSALSSASEYTATVAIPISRQARITRTAISPRLAMRTFRMGPRIGDFAISSPSLHHHQHLARPHHRALGDVYVLDGAGLGRGDVVLHL